MVSLSPTTTTKIRFKVHHMVFVVFRSFQKGNFYLSSIYVEIGDRLIVMISIVIFFFFFFGTLKQERKMIMMR